SGVLGKSFSEKTMRLLFVLIAAVATAGCGASQHFFQSQPAWWPDLTVWANEYLRRYEDFGDCELQLLAWQAFEMDRSLTVVEALIWAHSPSEKKWALLFFFK